VTALNFQAIAVNKTKTTEFQTESTLFQTGTRDAQPLRAEIHDIIRLINSALHLTKPPYDKTPSTRLNFGCCLITPESDFNAYIF